MSGHNAELSSKGSWYAHSVYSRADVRLATSESPDEWEFCDWQNSAAVARLDSKANRPVSVTITLPGLPTSFASRPCL